MEYVFNCRECGKDDKMWTKHEPLTIHDFGKFPDGYYKSTFQEGRRFHKPVSVRDHHWARFDYYGIYTELCCDACYKNGNYSYKKGAY